MFNKMIAAMLPFMPKQFVWIFSKRYVAGTSIDNAIDASKSLNSKKAEVTLDVLGEFITNMEEAEKNTEDYLVLIEKTQKEGVIGNYSVKPTMFGLLIDEEKCFGYIHTIVAAATKHNSFVRVDMEDSPCTDMEIELYKKLKAEFPNNVGLVLQAYLKRTLDDVKNLLSVHTPEEPLNFRLCKGIYVEPAEIAYKSYDDVNANYLKVLEFMFENKIYVGIATHDKYLITEAYKLLSNHNVSSDLYEFQMLYGVTPDLRDSIIAKGHKMRIYVPYGENWFGYSTRRLKENPKMAGQITKAIFIRG